MNVKKVVLTDHAYQRAIERFGLKVKDRQSVLGYCRSLLGKAKRIGVVTSEDGNEAVLYAGDRHAFFLTLDEQKIVTVSRHEHVTFKPIKEKLALLHEKEIRKLERKEHALQKKIELAKLEAQVEIAELKLRIHKTRSEAVKNACQAKIKAIEQTLEEMNKELNEIKSLKRQVAKSMVSIL